MQLLADAAEQLEAYFAGRRMRSICRSTLEGTAFQQRVWRELCEIPYGETISYGELAIRIGKPGIGACGRARQRPRTRSR